MATATATAIDLSARRAERSSHPDAAILQRVALALNSTLELREVLHALAEVTLDAVGAHRCSLLLLDGRVLNPAVAVGASPDQDLWSAFHTMAPVKLSRIPLGWEHLARGRAVAVEDAAASPLIPPSWVERFSLRSMVLVPLLAAGEPCGLMVVDYPGRRRFSGRDLALLEAIGSYAGMAVRNARLFETTRERAVVAERERMAADLHDTVGQLLVSIGLLARGQIQDLPAGSPRAARTERLAELADQAKWEIDQALRALAFVPAAGRGLVPSLRSLARSFERDSGIPVIVEVQGRPARLQPRSERALYRVAHQAFANAWRHARCGTIRAELNFGPAETELRIRDDGVGLGGRWPEQRMGTGIHGMRRAMDEVGGSLRLRGARPRGVLVEARVERESA